MLDFHHPGGSLVSLFSPIMFLGSLCATLIVPSTADILGRRMGIFISCITMYVSHRSRTHAQYLIHLIFAVILQGVSVNFRMFVAARFFLGFGVAIAHESSPLSITELVHPQHG
jgi:MFS family permease